MKKVISLLIRSFLFLYLFSSCEHNQNFTEPEFLPKQLTFYSHDWEAYLSPNGEHIVFFSTRNTYDPGASGFLHELWVMERDGSNQRVLVENSGHEVFEILKWSSNSDYIIVFVKNHTGNVTREIWKVNITGEITKLHSFDFSIQNISYSPDETKTAFITQEIDTINGSPIYKLYSANNNFSDTVLIENGFIDDYSWAKDSETLVYLLYESTVGYSNFWKVKANGTEKVRISNSPESKNYFNYSMQYNLIAYYQNGNIYVTPTDEFKPRLIFENAFKPVWVNNRDLILLYTPQSWNDYSWNESWVVDLNGNVVHKIAPGTKSLVKFSKYGHFFIYSISTAPGGGSLWLDFLP